MLAELRHARRGGVPALHVLLLCAAGRAPTEIATFLFCSRTSVYRIVNTYHTQMRDTRRDPPRPPAGGVTPEVRRTACGPCSRRRRRSTAGAARGGAVPPWPRHSPFNGGS